jgi:quercetin dioxygenase-like cupin family protein
MRKLGPGSVVIEPRGVAHYAMTKEEGAELQVNSTGPAGMKFVEPGR